MSSTLDPKRLKVGARAYPLCSGTRRPARGTGRPFRPAKRPLPLHEHSMATMRACPRFAALQEMERPTLGGPQLELKPDQTPRCIGVRLDGMVERLESLLSAKSSRSAVTIKRRLNAQPSTVAPADRATGSVFAFGLAAGSLM